MEHLAEGAAVGDSSLYALGDELSRVDDVALAGYSYDSTLNVETSDAIVVP